MPATQTYVDLYTLPVPRAKLDVYREQATAFGAAAREHGALSYREFIADDPGENMETEDGVVMTAAVVEFSSRQHRDEVMCALLDDPRLEPLMAGEPTGDMSRMRYGGFAPLVTV